jgi:hypothetical protein
MRRILKMSFLMLSTLVALATFPRYAHADMEGRMPLATLTLDSAGLDTSGPVRVEANQSERGITQLSVSAFGKLQTLGPTQLAALSGRTFNSIGLSYSRGYSNTGGRSVYVLLCQAFSTGVKVVAVVSVTEHGGVRVNDVKASEE